jgi:nicotinamide-nucleotide amidase
MNDELTRVAANLGERLSAKGWRIATAESCTGGGVAAAITSVAGSSHWFGYGLVTYANEAKQQLLGVSEQSLALDGAVSESVVRQMVAGILRLSGAEIGVAVTGIAGPGGGSKEKPVGGVWFAWAIKGEKTLTEYRQFSGSRQAVQQQAIIRVLQGAADCLEENQKNTV